MQIAKGVHFIPTHANSVLIVDDKVVLVDATARPSGSPVLDALAALKMKPSDVSVIVATHTHADHVGGLDSLRQASGAKVAAHELDVPFIEGREPYPPGSKGGVSFTATKVDLVLRDGDSVDGLRVIHAPGHTPGNLALLDEDRSLLIAGDTLRTEGARVVGPSREYSLDLKQAHASVKKVAAFRFDRLVVGHGDPIREGASTQTKALAAGL